jgi:hypothetical protein
VTRAPRAIGITVHTGWAACVVVGGSPRKPQILGNRVIAVLEGTERFCYHRAAEMDAAAVQGWLAQVHAKALARARRELEPLLDPQVSVGAIVAKDGALPHFESALATHMRIHSAEGLFYRDVFRDACQVDCRIIPAASLDTAIVGRLETRPWGRDQKLAAVAAWQVMSLAFAPDK